jgi:hypothetical protein
MAPRSAGRNWSRNGKPGQVVVSVSLCLCLLSSATARGDGGTLRLWTRAGDYQVAVFTAPTPLRAGPVDVSVLVQRAATGEPLPEAVVTVSVRPRDRAGADSTYPAEWGSANNKLFHAAHFELPAAGWWEVGIRVGGPQGDAEVRLELEAAEPLPRWLDLWPWLAWPALAILLFGIHQVVVRHQQR